MDVITVAIGVVSLGKYTLPNTAAFPVKVFDVVVNHVEKYNHGTLPAI